MDRHTERTIEQKSAVPLLVAYEAVDDDKYPKRDEFGGKKQGQSFQGKKDFFDEAGPSGTVSADWRMMTENVSPMVKSGGTIVDLGGNSGRYGEFLAKSRPDLKIIAIEPDPERFKLAQANIKKEGLEGRVTLINKPIPEALEGLRKSGASVDMITSVYRTHLQTDAENNADMKAMGALAKQSGASIVTHDLHRPQSERTVKTMAAIYPADAASTEFREGYEAGMKSAYRGGEMEKMLKGNIGGAWEDRVARPLGQMQMHLMAGRNAAAEGTAPKPNYPPTLQEYVDVAGEMNMILKAGGAADKFLTGVKNNYKAVETSVSSAVNSAQKSVDSAVNSAQKSLCENFSLACSTTKPLDVAPERGAPISHTAANNKTFDTATLGH